MRTAKSCGLILFRLEQGKRRYLVLHYPHGHWDLVKGHTEKGESEEETALREGKEETGLGDFTVIHGFKETMRYNYLENMIPIRKSVVFFIAATRKKSVTLSEEHTGSAWLSYSQAYLRLTYDSAKKILEKAEKFMQQKEKHLVRKN